MPVYELTYPAGTGFLVEQELQVSLESGLEILSKSDGSITIETASSTAPLKRLRTVGSVYECIRFDIPRPKAILGHAHFQRLIQHTQVVLEQDSFDSFRIDAAGRNSAVFQRIADELAAALTLPQDQDSGQLQMRFVRPNDAWEVRLRITPKPLSSREWRKANMPGALNACIAASMIQLLKPTAGTLVNLACGSGTLLIEASQHSSDLKCIGFETSEQALTYADQNLLAAGVSATLQLQDARQTDLPAESVDYLVSDLPWGERIGTIEECRSLYQEIIAESARIMKPAAEAVFLTQRQAELDSAIEAKQGLEILTQFKVFQKGFWPTVIHLRKS